MRTVTARGRHRISTAVAGVVLVATTALATSAHGNSTAVATTTNNVIRYHQAGVFLPTAGGSKLTVLSVNLPAGSWIIDAKTNAVNFGATDFVRCEVFRGSTQLLTGSTAMVGGDTAVADISNIVGVNSSTSLTVSLRCFHDNYRSGIYVENISMHAMKSPNYIDIAPA